MSKVIFFFEKKDPIKGYNTFNLFTDRFDLICLSSTCSITTRIGSDKRNIGGM